MDDEYLNGYIAALASGVAWDINLSAAALEGEPATQCLLHTIQKLLKALHEIVRVVPCPVCEGKGRKTPLSELGITKSHKSFLPCDRCKGSGYFYAHTQDEMAKITVEALGPHREQASQSKADTPC